jgi:hypothetical protein
MTDGRYGWDVISTQQALAVILNAVPGAFSTDRQSVPIRIREPLASKEILHTNGTLGLRYGASVRKALRFG